MNPSNPPSSDLVSIEDLDTAIVNLAAKINMTTYELLLLVRQFEDRAGYLKWGLKDAAEWLAYRCDIGRSAAYEKVRVARALRTLPAISASFSTGELSYSKVRAMTRVATAQNEGALLAFALKTTAATVEERCREMRYASDDSIESANRAVANRSLRVSRNAELGMMTVTVELPIETGELLEKALDKARDDQVAMAPDFVGESWSAQQADAFANMVRSYLAGTASDNAPSSDNYLVTVHVDQKALASDEGRSSLPIDTVKRLCCDGHAVVLTEDDNGEPLSIGRKSRIVPTGIKRAVLAKHHQHCAFPGCRNQRFLHLHHVEHWSSGGETSTDNLLPMCTRHHPLFHEGQFRIEKDFQDQWIFVRPDGMVIPPNGYLPQDVIDETRESSAEDKSVFLSKAVSEPPPPMYFH